VDAKFFQQKDGMAMESHPSLATSSWNIVRNWLLTRHNTNHRGGSGMLMINLWSALSHFNRFRHSIQFTMEIVSNSAIPFLDVLIVRKETTLATKVYGKPIHNSQYLSFKSNHPPHVKRVFIQNLHNRASTICRERQDLSNEISSLTRDLQLNCYPQDFIDSVINSKGSSRPNKEEKPVGSVYIPHVKGVSEMFKHIANRYNNIRTIFKTKHTLKSVHS
jgi:hypothetical protein